MNLTIEVSVPQSTDIETITAAAGAEVILVPQPGPPGPGGGGGGLDAEAVRDTIGTALQGSGLVSVTPNDVANTITVATTATANDTDANLKNRANHTGTQAISTVTSLQSTLDGKEVISTKGAANGYAPLDGSALVPAIHLPSYVDDVLEFANVAAFPGAGDTGKIYVALDINKTYRWSGSAYIEISSSPGSTDQVTEGATNKYYTDTRADARISAAVGTTVQGFDSDLTAFAAKTAPAGAVVGTTDTQTLTNKTIAGGSNTVTGLVATTALSATGTKDGTTYLRGDNTWATVSAGGGGDVTLTGSQTLTNKTIGDDLDFNAVTAPAAPVGGVRFYARTGVSGLDAPAWVNSVNVPMVIGRDIGIFARNNSGAVLTKGTAVYITSASGSTVNLGKAQADATMTKLPVLGVVAADIANGAFGLVIQAGVINNLNTSALAGNSPLYVDPTTAGAITTTVPTHPNVAAPIGMVINTSASVGSILVSVDQHLNNRDQGVNGSSWSVGDGTGAGAKTVAFKNANTGTLSWTPTAARTLTLPDVTATLVADTDARLTNTRTPTTGTVPYDLSLIGFGKATTRAAGTGDNPFGVKLQRACTFTSVTYRAATADASGNLAVKLQKNGSDTGMTNSPATIAAASQVAGGTATGTWSFAAGDILTVVVTSVGTTPGLGLIADITGAA